MNPAEVKAVWLLGSGFSAPLGGPLLSDLFRRETTDEILPFFPDKDYPDLAESLPWIQNCFHLGKEKRLWLNAEQYLAYVDDGYRGGNTAKRGRLDMLISDADPHPERRRVRVGDTGHVRHLTYLQNVRSHFDVLVKRGLASEVSRFLIQNPSTSEPWLPYTTWVASLRPGFDTILSFNYDMVVETAAKAAGVDGNFWFGIPGPRAPTDKVPFLKLHGSVSWRLVTEPGHAKRKVVDTKTGDEDLLCDPTADIAIAAPGGTKSDFVGTHFGSLWANAETALNAAAILYVVGYSFPDTDPSAQHRLLNAFGPGSGERAAHIVLGPDITPVSRRMLSLIQSTARGRLVHVSEAAQWKGTPSYLNIVRHPLFTQDFIGRHAEYTRTVTTVA